jgi:hypothetical protein
MAQLFDAELTVGMAAEDVRFRRALNPLRREGAATFTAGKRYIKRKRKTRKHKL